MTGPLYRCDRCPGTATAVAEEDTFFVQGFKYDGGTEVDAHLCLPCMNELVAWLGKGPKLEQQTKYDVHKAGCNCEPFLNHAAECGGCSCKGK